MGTNEFPLLLVLHTRERKRLACKADGHHRGVPHSVPASRRCVCACVGGGGGVDGVGGADHKLKTMSINNSF